MTALSLLGQPDQMHCHWPAAMAIITRLGILRQGAPDPITGTGLLDLDTLHIWELAHPIWAVAVPLHSI